MTQQVPGPVEGEPTQWFVAGLRGHYRNVQKKMCLRSDLNGVVVRKVEVQRPHRDEFILVETSWKLRILVREDNLTRAETETADPRLMHLAAKLATVLDNGFPTNCTPLTHVASLGDLPLVKYLVEHGYADVESVDPRGCTAAQRATSNAHLRVAKWLRQYGWSPLGLAARDKDWKLVKMMLLDSNSDDSHGVHCSDRHGWTVLARAAAAGNLPMVRWLVSERGASATVSGVNGWTPLARAAWNCQWKTVDWLLAQKSISQLHINARDPDGWTILTRAAVSKNWSLMERLVTSHGADIDREESYGGTALAYCARELKWDWTAWSLQKGAQMRRDPEKWSPLARAAKAGQWKFVLRFVHMLRTHLHPSEDMTGDTLDREGWSLLMRAANAGQLAAVKQLIEVEHASVDLLDKYGWTPIARAAARGYWEIVDYLTLQGGSRVTATKRDPQGITIAKRREIARRCALRRERRAAYTGMSRTGGRSREDNLPRVVERQLARFVTHKAFKHGSNSRRQLQKKHHNRRVKAQRIQRRKERGLMPANAKQQATKRKLARRKMGCSRHGYNDGNVDAVGPVAAWW